MRIARRALAAVIVAAVVASAGFNAASALEQKPALSVEVAEKAAMACDKYARAKGWKMNIAVLDDGGGLLYFRRDPASFRGSVDISINKAWTATQFGFPTLPRKEDRKSTRLNSSHSQISYAVFCLKKKKKKREHTVAEHTVLPYTKLQHD